MPKNYIVYIRVRRNDRVIANIEVARSEYRPPIEDIIERAGQNPAIVQLHQSLTALYDAEHIITVEMAMELG